MAFASVNDYQGSGTGTTADVTVSVAALEGELVVAYVARNDDITIDNDGGGAAWTEVVQDSPVGETARQALFWKIAGASEPTSYSWTLNGNDLYHAIVKIFSSSTEAEEALAALSDITTGTSNRIVWSAQNGRTIADDSLSVVFGAMDRDGTGAFTSADNSYVGVIGSAVGRACAGGHRIYTNDGETVSYDILTNTATLTADFTFSVHMTFLESAAPAVEGATQLIYLTGEVA